MTTKIYLIATNELVKGRKVIQEGYNFFNLCKVVDYKKS